MDESAIELLYRIAGTTIHSLEQLFARMPEFIGDFAAKKKAWPIMAAPFGSQAETIFQQLSDMGVGTRPPSSFNPLELERRSRMKEGGKGPRKSQLEDIFGEIVIGVVGEIEALRKWIRAAQRLEILDPESEISKRDWRSNFSSTVSKRLSWEHFDSLPDLDQSEVAQKQWYAVLKVFVKDNIMEKPEWERELREMGRSGRTKRTTKNLTGQRKRTAVKNPVWDRLRRTLKAIARPSEG